MRPIQIPVLVFLLTVCVACGGDGGNGGNGGSTQTGGAGGGGAGSQAMAWSHNLTGPANTARLALDGDELDAVYNLHPYDEEKAEALERWDEYLKSLRKEWVSVLVTELIGKGVEIPRQVKAGLERLPVH